MRPFETHQMTLTVVARLRKTRPGEVVPWAELSSLLECDAQEDGRHYVTSACRILLRESRVYEAQHGEGIRHLTDADISGLGHREFRRIHKRARRARRKLLCCRQWSALTPEQQQEYQIGLARIGYLEGVTEGKRWRDAAVIVANQDNPQRPSDRPTTAVS